ncbi:MAG: VanZ family protein [Woeseiaceae bacterium]|nr:VanZ family protein [Woeseiaceae bacterium]
MLPLRWARRWRVAGAFMLVCVLAGALMPALWLFPDLRLRHVAAYDKWLHAGAFLVLTVWFCGQYAKAAYLRLGAGLLLFGAVIELCQYVTIYRTADWHDLLADGIGIVTGLVVAVAGAGGWSMRAEHWLLRRQAADH